MNTRGAEKFGQTAAEMGWTLGLPHGWQWCPTCSDPVKMRRRITL